MDVLVEFTSPIGLFDFVRLEGFLAEILQQKVDLVTEKALKPAIKSDVLKEAFYI